MSTTEQLLMQRDNLLIVCAEIKLRICFIGLPSEPLQENGRPDWSKEVALLEAVLQKSGTVPRPSGAVLEIVEKWKSKKGRVDIYRGRSTAEKQKLIRQAVMYDAEHTSMEDLEVAEEILDRTLASEAVIEYANRKFRVHLVDRGTPNTVIDIGGREFRFSQECAASYREDDGSMTAEGLKTLAFEELSQLDSEQQLNQLCIPDEKED